MMREAKRWVHEHWWGILAILAAFVVVARTNTVGAPAEAGANSIDSMDRAFMPTRSAVANLSRESIAGREVDLELRAEIDDLRTALRMERGRSILLEQQYEDLADQFSEVTSLARQLMDEDVIGESRGGRAEQGQLAPIPIEAIYVQR